ncbi:MAG: hypothetical protein JSU86_05250, partial [Phycisphaerales bacterium]
PDAAAGDAYGNGVALGERAAVIGARLHDPAEINNAGAAYFHAFPADCNDNSIADTCDILGSTSDDCNVNGVPDECDVFVPGDSDGDGDVDLIDFAALQTCFTGKGPVDLSFCCSVFDFEPPDDDVDLDDYATFFALLDGP